MHKILTANSEKTTILCAVHKQILDFEPKTNLFRASLKILGLNLIAKVLPAN